MAAFDPSKAFDQIDRNALFVTLCRYNVSECLVKALSQLHIDRTVDYAKVDVKLRLPLIPT